MYNTKQGNIQVFDAEYFEHTLDRIATTRSGKTLWRYVGTIQGERCYTVGFNDPNGVRIWVRSSIHGERSADTGEDSIRAWLVLPDGSPLSVKVSEYVTRRPGWESRLKVTFSKLRQMRHDAKNCCGQPRNIYRSRNGKIFCRCNVCDKFGDWLDG